MDQIVDPPPATAVESYSKENRVRFLLTITVSLLLAFALQGCASRPKDVTYTASDLRIDKYFSEAKTTFRFKSPDVYEVTLVLGPLNSNRQSGQDAMYFIPALAILGGCSIKRLGSTLGYANGGAQLLKGGWVDPADPSKGDRGEVRFIAASALPPAVAGEKPEDSKIIRFESEEFRFFAPVCEEGMR
jgi:hypothetical protein